MWIASTAWGFWRSGESIGGSFFGVTVPNFGTGGTHDNPLDNDVDAGDEAAGVEFCPVFASQPSSGTLTVWTDGSLSLVGAADGTYVLPYDLYTFTPGDSASVDEGATTYTVTVGSAIDLDLDPAALALAGSLSFSGDIEIGTSRDLAADPVALSGSLAVSGDLEFGTSFDIEASPIALAGSLAVSGNIQSSTEPIIVARGRSSGGVGVEVFIDEAIEDDDEVIEIMQVLSASGVLWEA